MISRYSIILISLAFLSGCLKKSNTNEVAAVVKPIIEGLDKDSIKLLVHDSIMGSDSLKYDRIVFLDYKKKKSSYKKDFYKADSLYLKPSWASTDLISPPPIEKGLTINSCTEILKTYVSISKLNGSDIFFTGDYDSEALSIAYVKDSVVTFMDLMGWNVCYYKKVNCSNDKYLFEFHNNLFRDRKIEIKVIDRVKDIQIWKIMLSKSVIIYELKAPLNYALSLPMLVTTNTLGLIHSYENLDDLDLQKLFNQ